MEVHIANKANEAANEDEVIGSSQSELRFPGKGLGSTRSDFQKDERSGQQRKVGPHCRWEREKLREEKVAINLDIFGPWAADHGEHNHR